MLYVLNRVMHANYFSIKLEKRKTTYQAKILTRRNLG